MGRAPAPGDGLQCAALLRQRREQILAAWARRVRELPAARELDAPALLDHLPPLLERIASIAEELERGEVPTSPRPEADAHAQERLAEGFDLTELVSEFVALRACVHAELATAGGDGAEPLAVLDQAIDRAVVTAVDRYTAARDRTVEALDRVSTAGLESMSIDDLLRRLLTVFTEAVPVADASAILLREGDDLVVRAALGIDGELGTRIAWGDGFAGRVAIEARPLCLGDAADDAAVRLLGLRRRGIRALCGAPLMSGDRVIGVAYMGSASVGELSRQDRELFVMVANRAAAALTQQLLREASAARAAELEAVLSSIVDAVYVGDATGIKRANRPALEMLGFDSLEQLGHPISELAATIDNRYADTGAPIPPDDVPFARALRGEPTTREVLVRDAKTGEDRVLRSAAGPVRVGGRVVGAVAVNTDITEQKRLIAEMQNAVRIRDDLLAIVSHDLRNPLGVVHIAARALKRHPRPGADTAGDDKHVDAILRAADRMGRLIADLMDLAQLRGGRLAVDQRPEEVAALLSEAIDLHQPLARDKQIALGADLARVAGVRALCDRGRVQQVLANLLGNAITYCQPGATVTVCARACDGNVEIDVADDGPGIPAQELPHVFDAYWSVPRGQKRGTGLGLFIAKGIVESHGGRLWLESTPGRGTTFHFTLPRAAA